MTKFVKKDEINSKWYEIDAKNAVVGDQQQLLLKYLGAKIQLNIHHIWIMVILQWLKNIENIKFTGNKFENKKYYRHTGYPGGIKETTPEKLHEKKPEAILKLAVKRMLPGGPLAKKQLSKLKIYIGENHPHAAQNPTIIKIGELNNKNIIRN